MYETSGEPLFATSVSAIARDVGGLACVLHLGDVPPGIGLAAVEIGEAVDLRELPAGQRRSVPARYVGILRERRYGPATNAGLSEMAKWGERIVASRFPDQRLPHG